MHRAKLVKNIGIKISVYKPFNLENGSTVNIGNFDATEFLIRRSHHLSIELQRGKVKLKPSDVFEKWCKHNDKRMGRSVTAESIHDVIFVRANFLARVHFPSKMRDLSPLG